MEKSHMTRYPGGNVTALKNRKELLRQTAKLALKESNSDQQVESPVALLLH